MKERPDLSNTKWVAINAEGHRLGLTPEEIALVVRVLAEQSGAGFLEASYFVDLLKARSEPVIQLLSFVFKLVKNTGKIAELLERPCVKVTLSGESRTITFKTLNSWQRRKLLRGLRARGKGGLLSKSYPSDWIDAMASNDGLWIETRHLQPKQLAALLDNIQSADLADLIAEKRRRMESKARSQFAQLMDRWPVSRWFK